MQDAKANRNELPSTESGMQSLDGGMKDGKLILNSDAQKAKVMVEYKRTTYL